MDDYFRLLQQQAQFPDRVARDELFSLIRRIPAHFAEVAFRPYRCLDCGHEQLERNNHTGDIYGIYCRNCSWKARRPNFGFSGYDALEDWECVCQDCQSNNDR